jgi:hypothetical protein
LPGSAFGRHTAQPEMIPIDSRTKAALDAALGHLVATASAASVRTVEALGGQASKATQAGERDAYLAARASLRQHEHTIAHNFETAIRAGMNPAVDARREMPRAPGPSKWDSLTLVDDTEVEGRMLADRIGEAIAHECESELREMAVFVGALVPGAASEPERDPFRPANIGAALFKAIEAVTPDFEARKALARGFGPVMARDMRQCYADIVADLRGRGVQPGQLAILGVDGPGNDRMISAYAIPGHADSRSSIFGATSTGNDALAALDSIGSGLSSQGGHLTGSGMRTASGGLRSVADAELMGLIRRLTAIDSRLTALDDGASRPSSGARPASEFRSTGPRASETGRLHGEGLTGLMAVNLIRAHRDELREASSGGLLDHMVIDVVSSLFDQILSDPRVSPQMARQIARLQLPVLRVALADTTFFSSRKHPVRRFVNRIASLACAFEDFDDGPGRQFLERVRELVQEIIDGDFDQVDVYGAKLSMLEAFIEQQNEGDVEAHGAAATLLSGKESELRVQQSYMHQLQIALAPIAMDDYLRDFLSQVWSQALALAVRRDGPQAERTARLRRAATELVMSVQPKGTPPLRKAFLMQLPGLVKTLNEGMALIGWPEPAQRAFFGKLLPSHAESLKGQPLSDLDRNLLAKQLEAAFNLPLPRAEAMSASPLSADEAEVVAPHFSAEEVARVGLVAETAIDWNAPVDIEIGVDGDEADAEAGPEPLDIGIDIDLAVGGPSEPVQGPELIHHLQVGFAYQMHIKDRWQKVRLSYVSSGRSFFAFTHGRRHKETISFTSRMLARLCEAGRLRAFESSYLLERATLRARRQLAALKPGLGTPTLS